MPKKVDMPKSTIRMVEALCCDYSRMKNEVLRERKASEVLWNYKKILKSIDEALTECCETPSMAQIMLFDVGHRVGYERTEMTYMCSETYYKLKCAVKTAIAKKLNYI